MAVPYWLDAAGRRVPHASLCLVWTPRASHAIPRPDASPAWVDSRDTDNPRVLVRSRERLRAAP